MLKQSLKTYFLFFLSISFYVFIAYCLERHETVQLVTSFAILFFVYLWTYIKFEEKELDFWFYASIFFRLILFFAVPNLSDDFFRFVWDGRLLAQGYHPFAEVPSFYIESNLSITGVDQALYNKLNSKEYFTIYPPVAQFIFWLSAKLSPQSVYGSVIIMKLFILTAEVGSLLLLKKLTKQFAIQSKNILLYALNPLVIIELTGNLHFEALMIFFLLLSLYLLTKEKIWKGAVAFAFAICTKLLPLILLPVLIVRIGWKKSFQFYLIAFLVTIILFIPLYDQEIVNGFRESLGYYFQKFEFNASIYYLVREWGYWYYGYNIIQTVGWKLALISTILILFYTFHISKFINSTPSQEGTEKIGGGITLLPTDWIFIFFIYFLFTTTLHPWYITTLIALSVFSKFKFAIIWSGLIFLTYTGYTENGFEEKLWLTALEYSIMIGYLVWELTVIRKASNQNDIAYE